MMMSICGSTVVINPFCSGVEAKASQGRILGSRPKRVFPFGECFVLARGAASVYLLCVNSHMAGGATVVRKGGIVTLINRWCFKSSRQHKAFTVGPQSGLADCLDRANSGQVMLDTGHNPAPARINSFPSNGVNSKIARYAKGSKPGTQKRECAGRTDWPPIAPDRAKQADKVPYSKDGRSNGLG